MQAYRNFVLTFIILAMMSLSHVWAEDAKKPASASTAPAAKTQTLDPTPAGEDQNPVAEEESLADEEVPLSEAEAAPIRAKAEQLVKEEITSAGSFEVDHPETGDLLNLKLSALDKQVAKVFEGEYLIHGNFTDDKGATYGVDVYLEQFEPGQYEIVDAIVESINGKSVYQE